MKRDLSKSVLDEVFSGSIWRVRRFLSIFNDVDQMLSTERADQTFLAFREGKARLLLEAKLTFTLGTSNRHGSTVHRFSPDRKKEHSFRMALNREKECSGDDDYGVTGGVVCAPFINCCNAAMSTPPSFGLVAMIDSTILPTAASAIMSRRF